MNFLEAMALLKAKKCITREAWKNRIIVISSLEDWANFYKPEESSTLIQKTDWIECDPIQYFNFVEAITAFKLKSASIKRPEWKKWISFRCILNDWGIVESLTPNPKTIGEGDGFKIEYKFTVDEFKATDWMIIDYIPQKL